MRQPLIKISNIAIRGYKITITTVNNVLSRAHVEANNRIYIGHTFTTEREALSEAIQVTEIGMDKYKKLYESNQSS